MPDLEPKPKAPGQKSFWSTVPGFLTAIAGVVTATATLVTALVAAGALGRDRPTPTAAASAAGTPPRTVAATATAAPGILFEDDFSDTRHDWVREVLPEAEKEYEGGAFRITVYQPSYSSWSVPQPALNLADFILEADARRVSGPTDNEFGLIVRYQDATDDFYLFAISSAGMAAVEKYQDGEWQELVGWRESAAVRGGDEANRLRVTCQGAELRFFVNGELLASVRDSSFGAGAIGLLVAAGDQGGVVIAFDNVRVRALTSSP